MSQGCRRRSRLRASPWLNNGPKKPPAHIDLVSDESSVKESLEVGRLVWLSNKKRIMDAEHFDIRSEWGKGKQKQKEVVSDSEEVFVTPCELLSKSGASCGEVRLVDHTNLVRNMDLANLSSLQESPVEVSRSKTRTRVRVSRMCKVAGKKSDVNTNEDVSGEQPRYPKRSYMYPTSRPST